MPRERSGQLHQGSPPPMRGKVIPPLITTVLPRITPAYAGKSQQPLPPACKAEDHPRLCGEKGAGEILTIGGEGSPPPMRGKVSRCFSFCPCLRITPAYAGKRDCRIWYVARPQDHPRLCGEKFHIHSFITCQPGSPPPMRGKEVRLWRLGGVYRITPAYAGKRGCFLWLKIFL